MDYKNYVLNQLLYKYENSKSYMKDSHRRIMIKARTLSEYIINDFEEKAYFHKAVFDLQKSGLIEYNWEKFEENNILNEIWLNENNINKAYDISKRPNLKKQVQEIMDYLINIEFSQDYLIEFKDAVYRYMVDNGKEYRLLPYSFYKEIIDGLLYLQNEDAILERTFSIKCFGDSKFFEKNIKNYIVRIIKAFKFKDEEEVSDNDALLSVGLSRYPEVIEFNGNINIQFKGNFEICFNQLLGGSYINSQSIDIIDKIDLKNIDRVIFIENKTNYIDYTLKHQNEKELIIYHGGMYSPIKGEFFKKIYLANPNIEYYHWSDIDLGGFRIFERLKNNIINSLKPYKMDVESFYLKKDFWITMEDKYIEKLEQLLKDCTYKEFWDLITRMIDEKAKLEQESFIV